MRSGPVVHGVLLAAALGFAWQTWTRDRAAEAPAASVNVWSAAGPVEALALHGPLRDVTVERRTGEGGAYLWATVTKRTPAPAAPDAGAAPNQSVLEDKGTTIGIPVSDEGEKALARLAPLQALRDLGASMSKEEAGVGEQAEKLTVTVGGQKHELVLGAKVFGGDDRYVFEPAGGHVYVVAADVMRTFDAPEFSLRNHKLHAFPPADVASVVLRAGGKERTIAHQTKPGEGAVTVWADARTPDKPDQTLANFMDRIDQLIPIAYAQTPDAARLVPVGTIEYRGKDEKVLGTVEMTKIPAEAAGQFDYYVKSERTRGQAKVSPAAAARVEQDLAQLL